MFWKLFVNLIIYIITIKIYIYICVCYIFLLYNLITLKVFWCNLGIYFINLPLIPFCAQICIVN